MKPSPPPWWQLRHFWLLSAASVDHFCAICAVLKSASVRQPENVRSTCFGSTGGVVGVWSLRSLVSTESQFVILLISSALYVTPLWPAWMCVSTGATDENACAPMPMIVGAFVIAW